MIVGRIAVRDVAADGAAIADLRVRDHMRRFGQKRHAILQHFRRDELILGGHRTDADEASFFADAAQFRNSIQVDQRARLREPQFHHG